MLLIESINVALSELSMVLNPASRRCRLTGTPTWIVAGVLARLTAPNLGARPNVVSGFRLFRLLPNLQRYANKSQSSIFKLQKQSSNTAIGCTDTALFILSG